MGARCERRLKRGFGVCPELDAALESCLERIERSRRMSDPRRVVVLSPKDSFVLAAQGEAPPPGPSGFPFLAAPVFREPESCFVDRPDPGDVVATSDPETILSLVGASACLMFDRASFDELDALMAKAGRRLPVGFVEFLAERAADTRLGVWEDLFGFGEGGGAGLSLDPDGGDHTPSSAVAWFVEAFNFVAGIEEQRRLFEF